MQIQIWAYAIEVELQTRGRFCALLFVSEWGKRKRSFTLSEYNICIEMSLNVNCVTDLGSVENRWWLTHLTQRWLLAHLRMIYRNIQVDDDDKKILEFRVKKSNSFHLRGHQHRHRVHTNIALDQSLKWIFLVLRRNKSFIFLYFYKFVITHLPTRKK